MTTQGGYVMANLVRDLRILGRTNKTAECLAPMAADEIVRLRSINADMLASAKRPPTEAQIKAASDALRATLRLHWDENLEMGRISEENIEQSARAALEAAARHP